MSKEEILDYFKDINYAYNDCTRYDTLKRMLDELQEPCGDAISRQELNEYKRAWERLEEAMDKLNPDIDSFSIKNNACLLVRQYKPSNEVIQEPTCDSCKTPCVMYEKGMRGCNPTGAERSDKE